MTRFTRDNAKKFAEEAIDRVYDMRPQSFELTIRASILDVPEYEIRITGNTIVGLYEPEEETE